MEEYIRQLKETYQYKIYYFTVMGTLSLIDICGALDSSNGEASGANFIKWFNKYLSKYSSGTNNSTSFYAEECYKLRCRFLHQARAYIDSRTIDTSAKSGKIAFRIGPDKVHMCNSNGIYYLDIETFMNDVIDGVNKNITDKKNDQTYINNMDKIIKIVNEDPGRFIGNGIYIV